MQTNKTSKNKVKYRVILMRHSKAEVAGLVNDFDRELTPQGRRKINKAAKKVESKVAEGCYYIEKIVSSSAVRAKQTAQLLKIALSFSKEIEIYESLYLAKDEEYLKIINSCSGLLSAKNENPTIIFVGHEPVISRVALRFIDKSQEEIASSLRFGLSTANFVTLKSDIPFSKWTFGSIKSAKISLVD